MNDNEGYEKAKREFEAMLKRYAEHRVRQSYVTQVYLEVKKLVSDNAKPVYFSKN